MRATSDSSSHNQPIQLYSYSERSATTVLASTASGEGAAGLGLGTGGKTGTTCILSGSGSIARAAQRAASAAHRGPSLAAKRATLCAYPSGTAGTGAARIPAG